MRPRDDEERLHQIAHKAAGNAAYFQSFRALVVRGDWTTERIVEELERREMEAKWLELFARGADDAASQMHAEIHAHYRERHPLN